MARLRTRLWLGTALAALTICGFTLPQATNANDISTAIGKLRSVPDDQRGAETRRIALEIRKLPKSSGKVGLANGLANLSTEGDFGQDALQAVATTLAEALQESPQPDTQNGDPGLAYFELAQLERYEHVVVKLNDPSYAKAVARLDKVEQARAVADFTLTDITGQRWTRSALKGKVVLVNFWATWCPPCRKEMPDLEALYNRFKDKGLVVLGISDEDISKVKPFIAEKGYTFPILLDPGRKVNTDYVVEGIPKTFIYDRQGRLVAEAIDMRTQAQFLKLLAKAGLK